MEVYPSGGGPPPSQGRPDVTPILFRVVFLWWCAQDPDHLPTVWVSVLSLCSTVEYQGFLPGLVDVWWRDATRSVFSLPLHIRSVLGRGGQHVLTGLSAEVEALYKVVVTRLVAFLLNARSGNLVTVSPNLSDHLQELQQPAGRTAATLQDIFRELLAAAQRHHGPGQRLADMDELSAFMKCSSLADVSGNCWSASHIYKTATGLERMFQLWGAHEYILADLQRAPDLGHGMVFVSLVSSLAKKDEQHKPPTVILKENPDSSVSVHGKQGRSVTVTLQAVRLAYTRAVSASHQCLVEVLGPDGMTAPSPVSDCWVRPNLGLALPGNKLEAVHRFMEYLVFIMHLENPGM